MNPHALFEEELEGARRSDLYRILRTLIPESPVHARCEGREILLLCGNDYLGLTRHPRLFQAGAEAWKRYGSGAGAARLVSGTTDVHEKLEEQLAALKHREKAVVFSTGYLANLGVLSALAGPGDVIVMDKLSHASLIDGARLSGARLRVFPHRNYERCEALLQNSKGYRRRLLVSDAVFSMDGDLADLSRLAHLKRQYDALLILDDAHGTGVLGSGGGGFSDGHPEEAAVDVLIGTLSKALGCLGGFAATTRTLADYLVNRARPFIYATALPPAVCAAALEALLLVREAPELRRRLWDNAAHAHRMLAAEGLRPAPLTSPILPVAMPSERVALEISAGLLESGILIPAIRYPTVPRGKARLRLTVSAAHTFGDLERAICLLAELLRRKSAGHGESQDTTTA